MHPKFPTVRRELQRESYCRSQQWLLMHFCLSLLLLWATAAALPDKPALVTDAHMGIYTYDTVLQSSAQLANVRLQLRFLCQHHQQGSAGVMALLPGGMNAGSSATDTVTVEGCVTAFPITDVPQPWAETAQHYTPMKLHGDVNISITSRDSSTALPFIGPRDYGVWRVRTQLSGPGPFQLHIAGADTVHDLPQPLCSQQQLAGTPDLSGGIWNVLTTTSNTTLEPTMLAFLVLEHNKYHRSLGFSGTILRSNIDESRALIQQRKVQEAMRSEGLVIWPWEHEHVATMATHYWQKAKNQLTLLGSYGRQARLAFFDFDEYLVLPGGSTVDKATCLGRRLLDAGDDGNTGAWTFIRYQAKTCQTANADLPCWEAGQSPTVTSDLPLLHDVCPMSFQHGKQIMMADSVDLLSVHFSYSERHHTGAVVNTTCGYLLHFYSLLESRRALVTGILRKLPAATWGYDAVSGRREVRWAEGVAPVHVLCTGTERALALHRYNAKRLGVRATARKASRPTASKRRSVGHS